jgi:hypothetical protein
MAKTPKNSLPAFFNHIRRKCSMSLLRDKFISFLSFLSQCFKKSLKASFGQLWAFYKNHTAWPMQTSGVFVQHRSSEALRRRYFTAFASERPRSVGCLLLAGLLISKCISRRALSFYRRNHDGEAGFVPISCG